MRKISNGLIILLAASSLTTRAGDKIDLSVSGIPGALQTNANAVLRLDETRFEITAIGRAREYHHYAITILNERGDKHAELTEQYDKLHEIESITGTLYDAGGKKIRSLKKQDISDYSGTGDETLMADDRIKVHNFYYKVYPYTVEYEVETKYYYTMFFPRWIPQDDEHYAVQDSKITVICPADYKFRYKAFNYAKDPIKQTEKSTTSYTWEITNLPAMESEYAAPNWMEITPTLCLGPEEFAVEGYQGNMKSWQDFGKFVYALKAGKDVLPDAVKQKVHQLTDAVSDPKEKIRILYEYMQQNTHYISVQLGIGGWQPFDAKYVAERKYGDCKALSNYMYSLLREAGIKSYYTLVKAGSSSHYLVDDFPSSQFNHVILCVPQKADTIWLECTSQTLPAGYLSGFTADRFVLLVDEEGGKLVRTPKYREKDNLQSRVTEAAVDAEGNLTAVIHTQYRAQQMDELESMVNDLSKDKVMKILKSELDLPTYDVSKFEYREEKSAMPSIYETLDLVSPNYAQISGKRIFINPNIMNRSRRRLHAEDNRKYDIVTAYEYEDVDSTEIKIPDGYQPEAITPGTVVDSKFGRYTATVHVENNKIIYSRRLEKYSGRWPAAMYGDLVKFYEQLYKADNSRIVLVKKE
jgi:transglutaminase-like putative cysteine protease